MELVVTRLTDEALGVRGVELRRADGGDLPSFTAGAHVDLTLPGGLCRQYSLANAPDDRSRYLLGVGLSPCSRGGSAHVHGGMKPGDRLQVGAPRALFGLAHEATEHVFIAGGIGITPILSMILACEARGARWRLLYCVRTRARAAYAWTLAPHHDRVQLHVDEEAGTPADLPGFLARRSTGSHVYCCGPGAQMEAVAQAARAQGVPPSMLHFERFAAAPAAPSPAGDGPFTVVLHRSGRRLAVPAGTSLLQALEHHGAHVPFSCREGLCRSCELPLLDGEADHRDFVLGDDERAAQRCILPCVSRAISPELVLDL